MRVQSSIKYEFLIMEIYVDLTLKDDLYLLVKPLNSNKNNESNIYN